MDNESDIGPRLKEAEVRATKAATEYMFNLAFRRQLPHALEDYHVEAVRNDASPPYNPGEIRYLPLEAIVVSDDEPLPAAFLRAGITRDHSQALISRQQSKDRALWESEFSADRPFNPAPQFYTVLDEKKYFVVILDRESGAKRDKIIADRLKPLGYKGKKYSYFKQLADAETHACVFDFGTWRNTLSSRFTYTLSSQETQQRFTITVPFIYWTIGKYEHVEGISIRDIPLTTEMNLKMTFDNIAFLARKLEEDVVPQWRNWYRNL